MPGKTGARKLVATALPIALGLALVAVLIIAALGHSHGTMAQVTIGAKDHVYYSHAATKIDAEALGHALLAAGFFNDRGSSVMLSKGPSGTIVSFPVNEGTWDRPATLAGFEEIARRIASSVGGFPVQVRLCDANWGVRKELMVGKAITGARDEVYYYGSATAQEAQALGRALSSAGYFVDAGSSVVLAKNGATSISFVLGEGAWDLPGTLTGFETLARRVAPAVGGLPIDLRLLNSKMEVEREVRDLH